MADDWPKIKARRTTTISPWMAIIEREVEFAPGSAPELYHAVGQQDYIAIVARTPDGKIPIVRQYRPALEQFTWELPAGLVDTGETAADCCQRELLEETGFAGPGRARARQPTRPAPRGCRTGCIHSLSRPDRAPKNIRRRRASSSNW